MSEDLAAIAALACAVKDGRIVQPLDTGAIGPPQPSRSPLRVIPVWPQAKTGTLRA